MSQLKVGGPLLSRFVEHISLRTRPHHRDAQKLHYRRARSCAGGSLWWLVTFVGPSAQVAAAEALEIKLHRPTANAGHHVAQQNKQAPRRRPLKWLGRRSFCAGPAYAAWEGLVGGRQLAMTSAPPVPLEVDMSSWPFCQAYRHVQRCGLSAHDAHAELGAVSICQSCHRQLLLIWAASGHEVDWALLEKTWKVPCGPVALASFLYMVRGLCA